MAWVVPRGVHLSAEDCARLDALLVGAVRDVHLRNGGVPADVLDVVADIRHEAREFRANMLVDPGSGTSLAASGSVAGSSEATERLTVREAARLTGTSTSYLRRMARRGVVTATRSGHRGEWQLDGGALAAWVAGRSDKKAG